MSGMKRLLEAQEDDFCVQIEPCAITYKVDTPFQQVGEFHKAFNSFVFDHSIEAQVPAVQLLKLRFKLITEELLEFFDASLEEDYTLLQIRKAFEDLDRSIDLIQNGDINYVVNGAAHAFNIDLDAVTTEIHRSNMSKLGEDGKPLYREDGKILKGPNYFKPDIKKVLEITSGV